MKIRTNSVSGVALIIVLGFLVIISALAVAFFSSVNTELKASRTFAAGITTRQLAESSIQIVMGQIAAATTRGIDPSSGQGNEAWASQPGMIRVFGVSAGPNSGSTASANADAFYKLYSSDQMILSRQDGNLNGFDPLSDSELSKTWDSAPALWTDLNAPIIVHDEAGLPSPRFPIVDPRAYNKEIDPKKANDQNKWIDNYVEGFSYDLNSGVNGIVGPGVEAKQRLPMPVKWIYVLKDGSLTVPLAGSTTTASFTKNPPSETNPIVGRIAFWTDDETCKLNLNTAAGFSYKLDDINPQNKTAYQNARTMFAGSFWDSPRYFTQFDYGDPDANGMPKPNSTSGGLALCQLLQNEFQRYPGHPATTSLAPVFQNLLTSDEIYQVVPRYSSFDLAGARNSTMGGTNRIKIDKTQADIDAKQLLPKKDRLYANVDELLFGPKSRNKTFGDPSYTRPTNNEYALTNNQMTPALIDRLRFFVTADSRAPELNLFGQPRIACWPVRSEPFVGNSGLNVFDNLILFCSTVGNPVMNNGRPDTSSDATNSGVYRYIFTRKELSTAVGTDVSIVTHNDPLGGSPYTQYEYVNSHTPDWKFGRNTRLLRDYLPSLLARPIPGNGVAFANTAKFPRPTEDTQAILTEIFDYIRLANSQDTTTSISSGTAIQFAPRGIVKPSQPTFYSSAGKGFGRTFTLYEASIVFYYAGPQMNAAYTPLAGFPPNSGWSKWDPAAPSSRYVATITDAQNNEKVAGGYMRAFLLFSTFDPMQGYAPKSDPQDKEPKMSIECTWPSDWSVTVNGQTSSLGFPLNKPLSTTVYRSPAAFWGGRNFGGYEGFMHTLLGTGATWSRHKIKWKPGTDTDNSSYLQTSEVGVTTVPPNTVKNSNPFADTVAANGQEYYPFQTPIGSAIKIPGPAVLDPNNSNGAPSFSFTGGDLLVQLFYGGSSTNQNANTKALQTFKMNFPSNTKLPIPQGPPLVLTKMVANSTPQAPTADVTTWQATPPGANATQMKRYYWSGHGTFFDDSWGLAVPPARVASPGGTYGYQTSLQASWSFATRLAWVATGGTAGRGAGGQSYEPFTDINGTPKAPGYFGDRWRNIVQPGDTIRSLIFWDGNDSSGAAMSGIAPTASGDLRVAQLMDIVPKESFAAHPDYSGTQSRACVLRGGDGNFYFPQGAPAWQYKGGSTTNVEAVLGNHIKLQSGLKMPPTRAFANLPWGGGSTPSKAVNGVNRADHGGVYPGDFDNGLGDFPDGPFANKQDEGNVVYAITDYNGKVIYPVPYFTSTWSYQAPGNTFTSPSRQMPSPGMFGSLPSYAAEGKGWTTLSFSPVPAGDQHPGNEIEPKDHYLLDLFQMPVVEPYPISEPFSSAGKVNLNYRMVPFDYIKRSTALRGALYPLRVTAVGDSYYSTYKTGNNGAPLSTNFRDLLDRDKTIQAFDGFYDQSIGHPDDGFFKSASQICERYFYSINLMAAYPGSPSAETSLLRAWWDQNGKLTGDNEREKPYVDLYPRITTKSNTYTVHMKVQTLRQTPGHPTQWIEGKDAVLGEYRGSATIERYVDPVDPRFVPGNQNSINPDTKSVEPLYRFRTTNFRKFTP